jgi:hypothetical protein
VIKHNFDQVKFDQLTPCLMFKEFNVLKFLMLADDKRANILQLNVGVYLDEKEKLYRNKKCQNFGMDIK